MDSYRTFEDLECYKEARAFRKKISLWAKNLPAEEKYLLKDQMIRSSRSVSANIAEGYGRYHYKENIQFCRQARGSLTETLDHLNVALDEKYLAEESYVFLRKHYEQCLKLLNGYISYLQRCTQKK
ncbi:four helix bundle protein [Kiritimatiellaeota bacterium B1221]|nr:four helix bundle protein [Kiritimatiellaeota bacterium B1221]